MCFSLALAVYWRTAFPTVHTLDSAEFATAVATNGLVHSPGYPTYLLLARLTLLPGLEPARALHLASGLCAAATVAALALLLARLTGSQLAAFGAALFFAFTQYQWSEATIATPYTLNSLLLLVDLVLLLRWRADRRLVWLLLLVLLASLQLGVHASALLQAPAMVLLIAATDRRWLLSLGRLWRLALTGALGLLVWATLPLRAADQPALNFAREVGLDLSRPVDLWLYVNSDFFRDSLFGYPLGRLPEQLGLALLWLVQNTLGVGLPLGLVGLAVQFRRDRLLAAALGLGLLTHLGFYACYAVANKDTMFLPVHLIWATWVGEGLAWLLAVAVSWRRWLLTGAALALPLLPLGLNFRQLDSSQNRQARALAESALEVVAPSAALLGYWLEITPVQYLVMVERQRTDVETVNLSTRLLRRQREARGPGERDARGLPWGFASELEAEILERLRRGQAVYLFQPVGAGQPVGWRYERSGPLWRALPTGD